LRNSLTTTTQNVNVRQMTQLQPQSSHTMDGRPGSSDDVRPQSFASYLQPVHLRPQVAQLEEEESDDGRPGSIDDESPQSYASSPSTYYDWSDSPTRDDLNEDDDLRDDFFWRLLPRLVIPSTTATPQQVNSNIYIGHIDRTTDLVQLHSFTDLHQLQHEPTFGLQCGGHSPWPLHAMNFDIVFTKY
jgi:hypothetical protein